MKNIFDTILTVKEVAERYKLNPKYVQIVLWKGEKLLVGRDCCMKGDIWLILDTAAEKLWGHRRIVCPPGFRVCTKCRAVLPEDDLHFDVYRAKGAIGLTRICRGCLTIQDASWYQRNKVRLRPIRAQYARGYRTKYPEREARAVKRYKLRRAIKRTQIAEI